MVKILFACLLGLAAASGGVDCSKATCEKNCKCTNDKCASQVAACLGDSACAGSQDCALGCACGDDACILKCAASSPSAKALPLATCIKSNCNAPAVVV